LIGRAQAGTGMFGSMVSWDQRDTSKWARQAGNTRARGGTIRGAGCDPVCNQGHAGASQLEIQLGRGSRTGPARTNERKCGQWEITGAGTETGWCGPG